MNITQEKIDNLNAVIKVELNEADYKANVDKMLKDHRKKASIPGFRKGHVPMGMVKKMVGTNVLVDEINKILSSSLEEYINNEKLEVLGNPLPKLDDQEKIDWENQKDFEFKYEVGLAPQFDLKLSDKLKFDQYKIQVDPKIIENQTTDLAKRYGKMSNPEVSEAGDMLYGTFVELDGDTIKEGGIMHSSVIIIEAVTDKKLQKELTGKKSGDLVVLDPKKISENDTDQAAALGIKVEELVNITGNFNFTVDKINRMEAAELNQELFDKVFGPGNVSSEEEFKAKIEEQLGAKLTIDSDRKLKADIQEKILKDLKLELPNEFLKKWIAASNEKPITEDQINNEYESYADGLKWQLVENKIIKDKDIKVSHDEVMDHTKTLLKQQMASYGLPEGSDEELAETANKVLANQEEARNIYMMLYDQKIMSMFKETFKLKEKEISYDDFVKMATKK